MTDNQGVLRIVSNPVLDSLWKWDTPLEISGPWIRVCFAKRIHDSFLLLPREIHASTFGFSCYLASLALWTVVWLSYTLLLITTSEWVHTMLIFLSLSYLIQKDVFLVPSICLQISWGHHFFLQLSNTPLWKCTIFSISILWLRGI